MHPAEEGQSAWGSCFLLSAGQRSKTGYFFYGRLVSRRHRRESRGASGLQLAVTHLNVPLGPVVTEHDLAVELEY
jgi:hypothetical protein